MSQGPPLSPPKPAASLPRAADSQLPAIHTGTERGNKSVPRKQIRGTSPEYVSFHDNSPPPRTPVIKRVRSFIMTSDLAEAADDAISSPDLARNSLAVKQSKKRWRLGLFLLLVVVLLWVISSFMVNSIFESGVYRKPYLITYLSTACFSLYLVRPYLDGSLSIKNSGFKPLSSYDEASEAGPITTDENTGPESADSTELAGHAGDLPALSLRETAKLSLQFCVLWFGANWLANACLSYTTVASGTILACTSSFFTLLIGSAFGVEKFSRRKLLAIAASLAGIVLISTQDDAEDDETNNLTAKSIVVGDIMSLSSAAIYGLYTTLLKLKIGDESRINMQIFFGFVGIWNTIILWPILLILHLTGAETLEMPPTSYVWLIIVLNCLATLGSDYLWIVTILITSPLVVTMGLSGTIPLAVTGDIIFNHIHVSVWYLLGAVLVGCAFFVINRDEEREHTVQPIEEAHPLEYSADSESPR